MEANLLYSYFFVSYEAHGKVGPSRFCEKHKSMTNTSKHNMYLNFSTLGRYRTVGWKDISQAW